MVVTINNNMATYIKLTYSAKQTIWIKCATYFILDTKEGGQILSITEAVETCSIPSNSITPRKNKDMRYERQMPFKAIEEKTEEEWLSLRSAVIDYGIALSKIQSFR